MTHYGDNVSTVLNTLRRYEYGERYIFLTKQCYTEFKNSIGSDTYIAFSVNRALDWCETNVAKAYRSVYKNAIQRLNDVYVYNHVLGVHLLFHTHLNESYISTVESYLQFASQENTYSRRGLTRIKSVCTQFCCFLQSRGAYSFDNISYSLLEEYHHYILESFASYVEIEGTINSYLKFMTDNGYCQFKYSLFMHYIVRGKCTKLSDLSPEARRYIERERENSSNFPSSEFYQTISDFAKRLSAAGYSASVSWKATYHLTLLYLFLDREGLGYDITIADVWLKDVGQRIFGPDNFRKARRTIEMYEDYMSAGDVISHFWKHTVTTYDKLPIWCKAEIDKFLEAKRRERWASGTIISYRTYVSRFCQFLVSEGLDSFGNLTHAMIKSFNIHDAHKTPAGKNTCNRRIRQFLIHLEMRQVARQGLHFALPYCATRGGKVVEVLSCEDKMRINEYCERATTPLELRDAAILKIAMTTALRASDIVALKISDIDWKNRLFRVVQKKKKVERVYLMETCVGNAIFRYLRDGRYRKADSDYVFISIHAPYGPISTSACTKALGRAGTTAKDFHRLRKTCATDVLRAGATFVETAEFLGHTDTSNVHKYAVPDEERMRLCPLSLKETHLVVEGRYKNE